MIIKWSDIIAQKKENEFTLGNVQDRIGHSDIHWTGKQVLRMYENGELNFDNALQRALVWDLERKSLFIHSIIKNYQIDPIKSVKVDGVYDILDGKQRLLGTVISFMKGEFKLKGVPLVSIPVNGDDESMIDINDLTYEQLPEVVRCYIDEVNFTVSVLDEDTDEEDVNETFFRCNNYKPMAAIDLTRAKAKSQKDIYAIAHNKLFIDNLTESMLKKYANEDIVIKSYMMLHEKDPSLSNKDVRNYIVNIEFSDDDISQLNQVFDRIHEMYKIMKSKKFDDIEKAKDRTAREKFQAKIAKRIISKTHLVSVIPIIWKSIAEDVSVEDMVTWFESFFCGPKKATVCALYNEAAAGSGTAKKENVKRRNNELNKNFDKFLKNLNKNKMKEAIAESNADDPVIETKPDDAKAPVENTTEVVNEKMESPETHQMTIDEVITPENTTDEAASPAA